MGRKAGHYRQESHEGKAGGAVGSRLYIPGATRMGWRRKGRSRVGYTTSETIPTNEANMAKECGSTTHAPAGLYGEWIIVSTVHVSRSSAQMPGNGWPFVVADKITPDETKATHMFKTGGYMSAGMVRMMPGPGRYSTVPCMTR